MRGSSTNTQFGLEKACLLQGLETNHGGRLRNLGAILMCAIAVITAGFLLWLSQRKKAAVGRREMQVFLVAYALMSAIEVFTVGGFLGNADVLMVC